MIPTSAFDRARSQGLLDVLIRAAMIFVLAAFCYMVFHPFLDLMLWSLILAVTLFPLQCRLRRRLRGRDGRAATLIVVIAIGVVIVPVYLLGASIAAPAENAIALVRTGALQIPAPADSVANWPLVGGAAHDLWTQAATDLTVLTQKFAPQLKALGLTLLGMLAGFGLGLLMFIAALILAGIFMAYGDNGNRSALQIASRIVGPVRASQVVTLCTHTIRAVAQGVIGIAFIQMMLIGLGFILLDIPGAGLLALAVLLLGITQLPATLITVPVIIYVFATGDVSMKTIILSIYLFVAGLVDNVLKPLLLGRGVEVPMPVVLIGALGGMVTKGVIGLFIGPVVLAVAYALFWDWVREGQEAPTSVEAA